MQNFLVAKGLGGYCWVEGKGRVVLQDIETFSTFVVYEGR